MNKEYQRLYNRKSYQVVEHNDNLKRTVFTGTYGECWAFKCQKLNEQDNPFNLDLGGIEYYIEVYVEVFVESILSTT
jgi:hypothetical protein